MSGRVAIVKWNAEDGIAEAIASVVRGMGWEPLGFMCHEPFPRDADIVFCFAPYGRFMQIPRQLDRIERRKRPIFIHWNTENPPDLRIPWPVMKGVGDLRSWVDRLNDSDGWSRSLLGAPPIKWVNQRLHKFRYVGEYHYAWRKGWIDVFVESSAIYADLHKRHGLPAMTVPWGTVRDWHADLGLERDVDVLWMGKRRTKRRSDLLDRVRADLKPRGISVYVADDVEKPFVFGDARIELLNRSKITLNLLPTWYDHAFPYRFHIAAGNRSMVVSEPFLPHCPTYEAGVHYAAAPIEQLAETIERYVKDDDARVRIAENAYQLATTELTFDNSVRTIMQAAEAAKRARAL